MDQFIYSNTLLSIFLVLLATFLFTYYLIPKIINVVNHKRLMESPNHRSSHTELTPTFGGVSFFIILVLTLLLVKNLQESSLSINIIAGLTIILFTGLKDDLVIISHRSKLLGQSFAGIVFLYSTKLYNINLNGFLGLHEMHVVVSFILTLLIIIIIINAFNLIDGIDGLAASIGIIILTIFAVVYYFLELYFFTFMTVSLVGSLLAFLRFNLSSRKKIFMGDTGSMIIGFIVSVMTLKFLSLTPSQLEQINFVPRNSPFVILSILIFPIFDMIRILMLRISKKRHPLLADKNHSHHVLLERGNSHRKTSVLIGLFSLIASLLLLYLATVLTSIWMLLAIFLLSYLVFLGLFSKLSLGKQ
ncbi:MAG: MraY family glycosyltransferase [Flavobacteriaceae bacterium]|nr:MraY family glycosyltransferase [Flavobacteriaceae bacterium]